MLFVYLTKMGRTRKTSVSEADAELVRILTESGKKEELRDRLMDYLGDPSCGWRDQVKLVVLDIVHDRGAENLAIEDLVQEVAPRATDLVSNSARSDLSKEVKKFLKERAEEDY